MDKEVIGKVLNKLKALSKEEFLSELEKHRDDPLVKLLEELSDFSKETYD